MGLTGPIEKSPEAPISPRSRPSPFLPLHNLAARPMPSGIRGALVQRVSAQPDGPLDITWLTAETALPRGRIRLHWEPAPLAGWDVTAHLGLATTEAHLASWPAASDAWPHVVRPTLHEVLGLCAALAVATAALDLSNHLAQL